LPPVLVLTYLRTESEPFMRSVPSLLLGIRLLLIREASSSVRAG
jgi:hypothetical protein